MVERSGGTAAWLKRTVRLSLGLPAERDTARLLRYRPELFGQPFLAWAQSVMRGPSAWSVPGRELLAAYVSRQDACTFCVSVHAQDAAKGLPGELVAAVLHDPQTAPVDERLRATLAFIATLARTPAEVGPADVEHLRAYGLSDGAIEDAIPRYTCARCSA